MGRKRKNKDGKQNPAAENKAAATAEKNEPFKLVAPVAEENKPEKSPKRKFTDRDDLPDADLGNIVQACKDYMEGKLTLVDITPEQWGCLCKKAEQGRTRDIKMNSVRKYTSRMEDKKWVWSGYGNIIGLMLDKKGNVTECLGDGQHRAYSAFHANATSKNTLVIPMAPDVVAVTDDGAPRSTADTVFNTIDDISHRSASVFATALQVINTLEKQGEEPDTWSLKQLDNQEVKSRTPEYAGKLFPIVEKVRGLQGSHPTLIPLGYVAAFYYYLDEVLDRDAESQITTLLTGADAADDNALKVLRDHLMVTKNRDEAPKPRERTAMLINALNAVEDGTAVNNVDKLRWASKKGVDSKTRGPFPSLDNPAEVSEKAA